MVDLSHALAFFIGACSGLVIAMALLAPRIYTYTR
jgi:hypothetical protein